MQRDWQRLDLEGEEKYASDQEEVSTYSAGAKKYTYKFIYANIFPFFWNKTMQQQQPSEVVPPSVTAMCIDSFVKMEEQFLASLIEVFPECPNLRQTKLEFNMACTLESQKQQRVEEWIQYMGPFFSDCTNKQAARVIVDRNFPPSVQAIEIQKKWQDPDIDEETREAVWAYLNELNRLAQMYQLYSAVPGGMMSTITSMAQNMATQIQSGNLDMSNLNLQALSEQVSQQIDQNDLNAFASNINPNSMGNLMNMMGDLTKNQ
tara:strand:+ start:154 stop:939 length:786 start_codon:yes stop_codon:yes gene_type:complete